jgi:flagellar secretion chaperone FliS
MPQVRFSGAENEMKLRKFGEGVRIMTNPLNAYRETKIRTAGPGQIVLMLYAEAVKQCDVAIELLSPESRKKPELIERINQAIGRAQDIVTELMASLDFEAGGEIAKNLFSLYTYFNRELMEANIAKSADRVKAVRGMLEELRLAWVEAVKKVGDGMGGSQIGVNISG